MGDASRQKLWQRYEDAWARYRRAKKAKEAAYREYDDAFEAAAGAAAAWEAAGFKQPPAASDSDPPD